METLSTIVRYEALFLLTGLALILVYRLFTGQINTKGLLDDKIHKRMTEFGSVAVSNSPDVLARMLREETEQWAALVKEIGLNTQNAKLGR